MHFRAKISHPLVITGLLVFATAGLAAIAVRIDDSVPNPNLRTGSPDNVIIDDYQLTKIAEGTDPLENPSGPITTFGFLNATPIINGTKTEPDENTYVVFGSNPGGPTANFNYGGISSTRATRTAAAWRTSRASTWTSRTTLRTALRCSRPSIPERTRRDSAASTDRRSIR